ncbi:MAG: hypothetical protein IKD69_00340 [Solobacterium sp.]|nr:hypothetical protein [Solobacterium sp.]
MAEKNTDQVNREAGNAGDQDQQKTRRKNIQWHEVFYALLRLFKADDPGIAKMTMQHEVGFDNRVRFADTIIFGDPSDLDKGSLLTRGFFRELNYIEYKGIHDTLTMEDLKHAHTGCSMAVEKYLTDNRHDPAQRACITCILARKPDKLLDELTVIAREKGVMMNTDIDGIYRITFYQSYPIQIVVMRELTDQGLLLLKALTENVGKNDAAVIFNKLAEHADDFKAEVEDVLDGFNVLNPILEKYTEAEEMNTVIEKVFPEFMAMIRKQFADKDEQISKKDEQLNEKDEQLSEKDEQLSKKDEQISSLLSSAVKRFRSLGLSNEEIMDTLEIDLSTLQMYLG